MDDARTRFEPLSPWVATPEDLRPRLEESLRADVVVVGGGYTGLSAALALCQQGADVVLLERDFAGSGASGRNAGHLTPTIGKDVPTLLRLFGRERAARLVRFADAAVEHTEETIRKHGIACDYEATGNVLAAVHPKQVARLARAAETARGLGAAVRFLPEGALRERGLPPAFHAGVMEERGGTLHPGRYVEGLRRAALASGVRLFEGTPLQALERGPRVTARCAHGAVTADHAVLATNAWTPGLGRLLPRAVAALRVLLIETEPLDADARAALGWPGREGVYTAHEILESWRLTARDTLVGGSKMVRYAWGSALPDGPDPEALATIAGAFRARFPALREVPIVRYWGGWIAFTPDFLPRIGTLEAGGAGNVHYGLGYAGHGVAQATLMGEMLAARIQGRTHEAEPALRRRTFGWPPEPFRWAAAKVLNGALSAVDRRTDRQIAGR
ncbi:MAG: FAD-binding oxidoreductase [Myxococcota bacterium]|nr:FAD-binding oxidoreductase [Myxococcota bacterium]